MLIQMTKTQYREWHKTNYPFPLKPYILDRYEFLPEPAVELKQFEPVRCKMKFGAEWDG